MKRKLTHIMILMMAALLISSCNGRFKVKPLVGSPLMRDLMKNGPKNAPNLFKEGWRDGCETGVSATSNAFQRQFYRFTQDHKLAQNPVYYNGWKNAYNFCQRYVFQYLRRQIL